MRDIKAVLRTNGQNHKYDREECDLYTTPKIAVDKLLEAERFSHTIFEPCCGTGSISDVLINNGYEVICNDIIDRGYDKQTSICDYLKLSVKNSCDIITNPPYSLAEQFVRKSLEISDEGTKIAMLLKLTFLEGQKRRKLFDVFPPSRVYVFSKRIRCNKGGQESEEQSAVCYAWFIWVKGQYGIPQIYWI